MPVPLDDDTRTPASRTARERVRRELTREITDVARRHLAEAGAASLSVRAIARELGMASSALFRYFPNRDALLTALIVDSYGSLGDHVEAAERAVHDADVATRWSAVCHGVRDWARTHPHEYALIYGSPVPGYAAPQDTVGPASRVPLLLGSLLADLAARADDRRPDDAGPGAPPAAPAPEDDALAGALAPVRATMPDEVPVDLLARGLMAWTFLFGAVSFETFGHLHGVVDDLDAWFDHEVHRVADALGLR